jgi:hypothetical protein
MLTLACTVLPSGGQHSVQIDANSKPAGNGAFTQPVHFK